MESQVILIPTPGDTKLRTWGYQPIPMLGDTKHKGFYYSSQFLGIPIPTPGDTKLRTWGYEIKNPGIRNSGSGDTKLRTWGYNPNITQILNHLYPQPQLFLAIPTDYRPYVYYHLLKILYHQD